MTQPSLLTVDDAEKILFQHLLSCEHEACSLPRASGRILREAVLTDRPLPPYDRVTMDGIAIAYTSWAQGQRAFPIAFTQAAGATMQTLEDAATCARVMTGSVLPGGTDTIIPREEVTFTENQATINDDAQLAEGQFIHRKGVDIEEGQEVLSPGLLLRAPEMMIAASAGYSTLQVARAPSVAVISNGDELVEVEVTPEPHQVRTSNSYGLHGALAACGVNRVDRFHFPDDAEQMEAGIRELTQTFDILIFTGGISVGDYDHMPRVLAKLGIERVFHKVGQRPGKPFWFGQTPEGRPAFALPGNPVSTLVCFHRYIRPWLLASQGLILPPPLQARLSKDVPFKQPLTYFLQVTLATDEKGHLIATPAPHHGSGDFASLAGTDGFVELRAGQNNYPVGYGASFYPWG